MEISKSITLATPIKRTFAGIIDFFLIAFFALALFAFAGIPLINVAFNGADLVYETTRIQTESHLFINDEGVISTYPYYDPDDEETPLGLVEKAIYRYYVESSPAVETGAHLADAEAYYDTILLRKIVVDDVWVTNPDCLFDFAHGLPLNPWDVPVKATTTATEKYDFYIEAYQTAINDLENNHAELSNLNNQLSQRIIWGIISGFILSLAIFQIAIPLILKDGATIGKRLLQLAPVNVLGYAPKRAQTLLRNIAVIIIHYLLVFFAVPFISLMFLIFRKDHRDLVDLSAATLIVDTKNSIIYQSAQEEDIAASKIADIHAKNAALREQYAQEEALRKQK